MSFQDQIELLAPDIKSASIYLSSNPFLRYVLVGVILFVLIGIVILSRRNKKLNAENLDMNAIAGEDVMATQLDLAKAYIEMNQKDAAKKILKQTIKRGSLLQKQEARQLLQAL